MSEALDIAKKTKVLVQKLIQERDDLRERVAELERPRRMVLRFSRHNGDVLVEFSFNPLMHMQWAPRPGEEPAPPWIVSVGE